MESLLGIIWSALDLHTHTHTYSLTRIKQQTYTAQQECLTKEKGPNASLPEGCHDIVSTGDIVSTHCLWTNNGGCVSTTFAILRSSTVGLLK
jgi:hypothetical protein